MNIRTSRNSVVSSRDSGSRFTARVRTHQVPTDQPEKAGGSDTAPTPLELLSVALASCIALYLGRYAEAHSLDADDLAVEVKPFWRDDPGRIGRFDVIVHLPDSTPAEHRNGMEEVARNCPVHRTLTSSPEVTVQLRDQVTVGSGAV